MFLENVQGSRLRRTKQKRGRYFWKGQEGKDIWDKRADKGLLNYHLILTTQRQELIEAGVLRTDSDVPVTMRTVKTLVPNLKSSFTQMTKWKLGRPTLQPSPTHTVNPWSPLKSDPRWRRQAGWVERWFFGNLSVAWLLTVAHSKRSSSVAQEPPSANIGDYFKKSQILSVLEGASSWFAKLNDQN